MASDAIALDSIRALFDGGCPGFELACVVSNPDRPKGRGKKDTKHATSSPLVKKPLITQLSLSPEKN